MTNFAPEAPYPAPKQLWATWDAVQNLDLGPAPDISNTGTLAFGFFLKDLLSREAALSKPNNSVREKL